MLKYLLLIFSVFLIFEISAQRKQGSWLDYLSYSEATKIAVGNNKVFCASSGGLFYYDVQDNSVVKISEIFTLSDFGIKTIAYNSTLDVLVIAYNNSNIDLVYKNRVINLSDIKRKQLTGDKTIYNISFIGKEAYLSTGFGIVVLNLEKQGYEKVDPVSDELLEKLKNSKNQFLPYSDKTDPEEIKESLGISKKTFKKAIGLLYKQKRISIDEDGIRLIS